MDTVELLQSFYRDYRERRLADAVSHLSDDFLFRAYLPLDPAGTLRPRSRAEFTLICHKFLDDFDILVFEPGSFAVDGELVSVTAQGAFRHKSSGKMLEMTFQHRWRLVDGKVAELSQEHDSELLIAFIKGLDGAVY